MVLLHVHATAILVIGMILMPAALTNFGSTAYAKGLDSIQPAKEDEGEEEEAKDGAKAKDGVDAKDADKKDKQKGKGKDKDKGKDEDADPKAEAATTGAQWIVGTAPDNLRGKAWLEVSYGWMKASAAKGDWDASGLGDVSAKYRILDKPYAILAKARYAPFDVTVHSDDVSYRGSVSGYHLGAEAMFPIKDKLTAMADVELGLMTVYLYDIIDIATDTDLEKNGANFFVGGGLDWNALENVNIGPRLYLGFGRFSTFQFSVASALVF